MYRVFNTDRSDGILPTLFENKKYKFYFSIGSGWGMVLSKLRWFQKDSSRFWVLEIHPKCAMKPDFRFGTSVLRNSARSQQQLVFVSLICGSGWGMILSKLRWFQKDSSRFWVLEIHPKCATKPDFRSVSSVFRILDSAE